MVQQAPHQEYLFKDSSKTKLETHTGMLHHHLTIFVQHTFLLNEKGCNFVQAGLFKHEGR